MRGANRRQVRRARQAAGALLLWAALAAGCKPDIALHPTAAAKAGQRSHGMNDSCAYGPDEPERIAHRNRNLTGMEAAGVSD